MKGEAPLTQTVFLGRGDKTVQEIHDALSLVRPDVAGVSQIDDLYVATFKNAVPLVPLSIVRTARSIGIERAELSELAAARRGRRRRRE